MSTPNTNPLSYNQYIQQIGAMAVYGVIETAGVYAFVDAPPDLIVPQMLNYAERRIQRDLDPLQARTSKTYTLTAGSNLLSIPVNDFFTVETFQVATTSGATVLNTTTCTPVSREFLQVTYGSPQSAGMPKFFAMAGDTYGDGGNTNLNIQVGPYAATNFSVIVNGVIVLPSLYQYAVAGVADTAATYISTYCPDLLIMASMVYLSAFQRNFSATSDSPDMPMSYEKQYQALRLTAIAEENRRKQFGSAWTAYSVPATATPTR